MGTLIVHNLPPEIRKKHRRVFERHLQELVEMVVPDWETATFYAIKREAGSPSNVGVRLKGNIEQNGVGILVHPPNSSNATCVSGVLSVGRVSHIYLHELITNYLSQSQGNHEEDAEMLKIIRDYFESEEKVGRIMCDLISKSDVNGIIRAPQIHSTVRDVFCRPDLVPKQIGAFIGQAVRLNLLARAGGDRYRVTDLGKSNCQKYKEEHGMDTQPTQPVVATPPAEDLDVLAQPAPTQEQAGQGTPLSVGSASNVAEAAAQIRQIVAGLVAGDEERLALLESAVGDATAGIRAAEELLAAEKIKLAQATEELKLFQDETKIRKEAIIRQVLAEI